MDAEEQQDGARMEGAGAQDSTEALGTDIPAQSRPLALAPPAHPLTIRTQLGRGGGGGTGRLEVSAGPSCISAPASGVFPRVRCV